MRCFLPNLDGQVFPVSFLLPFNYTISRFSAIQQLIHSSQTTWLYVSTEPQEDHAVVMTKFAGDCIVKLNQLMHILVEKLGEDTAERKCIWW